jgi:hypothetical protein
MTKELIQDYVTRSYEDYADEILLADGFENAFMGIVESFGSKPKALYNSEKCIDILMDRDGMDYHEATEYFSFNVEQAYVGEYTPAFMEPFYELKEEKSGW